MMWNSILLVSFILAPAVIQAKEAPEIDLSSAPQMDAASALKIDAASAPEIDAASAAMLRRIAEKMPVLQFKRAFAGVKYADWMAMMPEKIQNMPLSGIAIPGSHDSFTASLDYHGDLGPSPDLSDTLVKVVNFFGSMAKKIIYNWGVTQGLSISDQLFAGIRYFDFRVAKRDYYLYDNIFLLHSLFAQSANEAFAEIQDFLNTHEKEVVIIDINHFYGMDAADHRRFISSILSTFGKKLTTVRDFDQLTLANLWKGEERVILVYQAYYRDGRDNHLWHDIVSPWPNTNSVSKAIEKLDMYYKIGHDPIDDGFWVTQGILTPTANDIIWGVASSLRKKLALPMCRAISDWVKDKTIGKGGINIVITDFVEENNFIGNVIGLNLK